MPVRWEVPFRRRRERATETTPDERPDPRRWVTTAWSELGEHPTAAPADDVS